MRSFWLASALLAAACFSESQSTGGCIEGEAACDCRPDGTCIDDHECVASIDKCVPTGCTPGSESCTCVDGGCLAGFVCNGGVCVPPSGATTGNDPSVASSLSDTVAETGPDPTMATTDPSDSSDPTASDPTIPPDDTSATDSSASMSGSVSSDPSVADTSMSVSESETSPPGCPTCIATAGQDVCETEYGACDTHLGVGGCAELMGCMMNQLVAPEQCCAAAQQDMTIPLWNTLVGCAQDSVCVDECDLVCR